jgi:hypothetical protein
VLSFSEKGSKRYVRIRNRKHNESKAELGDGGVTAWSHEGI